MQDGKLLIYYGGSPTVHLSWKRFGAICLARLREDGELKMEVLREGGDHLRLRLTLSPHAKLFAIMAAQTDTQESFDLHEVHIEGK